MAELTATRMLEWRRNSQKLYANEFRMSKYGAIQLYLDAARRNALVDSDVRREALGSTGNTIKIQVMKDNATAQVGTERSCTPVNNRTDSALVPVTFTSLTDGFTMYPNEYDNNDVKYQQHFEANMISMTKRLLKKLDQLALANLEANKTQVLPNTLGYAFGSNKTVAATWDDRMDLLGDLNAMLAGMNFDGDIRMVGNMGIMSLLNKLAEHGKYNDVNKAMEYMDKEFFATNQLSESGTFGALYAVAGNQVDILSRVSRAEYHGSRADNHIFGTTTLPMLEGLTFGTHFIESVGDQSTPTGNGDMICDIKHEYGFAVDIAFVNAYESDAATNGTGILKATIANGLRGVQTVAPAAGSKWPNS